MHFYHCIGNDVRDFVNRKKGIVVEGRVSVQEDILRKVSSTKKDQTEINCLICRMDSQKFGTEANYKHILVPPKSKFSRSIPLTRKFSRKMFLIRKFKGTRVKE